MRGQVLFDGLFHALMYVIAAIGLALLWSSRREFASTDAGRHLFADVLIGFGVWKRRTGSGINVTFPARQYSVNGERRSFALLRPITDDAGQSRIRDLIVQAYEAYCGEAGISVGGK